jgi:hypothetical protein
MHVGRQRMIVLIYTRGARELERRFEETQCECTWVGRCEATSKEDIEETQRCEDE